MGHELGVEPRDWNAARVRWALTYPEIYEVGSSNLGHIILYSILINPAMNDRKWSDSS